MALTKSQRQTLWRARRDIKARFFEDLDRQRQDELAFPESVTSKPEGAALAHFFVNYPLCRIAPAALTLADGIWVVEFDAPESAVQLEVAAAIAALREFTSLPVLPRAQGRNLAISSAVMNRLVAAVASQVRDMRDARMWGAQ